jgi:signal transduction histidine kinase
MTPITSISSPAALSQVLLQQNPECTWLLKPDLNFQAVYGNARKILGHSPAELAELKFDDLFALPVRGVWTRRIARVFAGETLSVTGRFGEDAPAYAITLFPVRLNQGATFAGGTAHEIPERDLVLRTLQALDADRARLAQFLHDHLGQQLSAAGLQFDLLRMDLAAGPSPVAQRAADIQATLESLMGLVREFNCEFNPAVAERVGLRAALDKLAGRIRTNFQGNIRVLAHTHTPPAPQTAAALYRIAQEAAGHAARQPGCSVIELMLKSLKSGPVLEIRNNGPGIDISDGTLQGWGLAPLVMQHYADQANIDLRIDSSPAKGTVVRAACRRAD